MKKRSSKLWIVVVILFAVSVIASLSWSVPVTMEKKDGTQTTPGYGDTVIESDGSGDSLGVKENFKRFVSLGSDLINVVFRGESSKYDNPLDVLIGEEDVSGTEQGTQEESTSAEYTVADTVQAGQEKKENAVITSCTVSYVIDGDTFVADFGNGVEEKIRLIGIDTPESVHADEEKNTIWGQYASDHTKAILSEGQTVYLEYDVSATDKYGRTLAYVWLSEDTSDIGNMLNAKLLADGYAMDKVYAPNDKYANDFKSIRQTAEYNGTGLWKDEGFAALWE